MSKNFTTNDTAVVLVDHQVGTINWAGELTPEEREQLKMWVRVFARFAKAAGMPVVLTSSLETEAQGPLRSAFRDCGAQYRKEESDHVGVDHGRLPGPSGTERASRRLQCHRSARPIRRLHENGGNQFPPIAGGCGSEGDDDDSHDHIAAGRLH